MATCAQAVAKAVPPQEKHPAMVVVADVSNGVRSRRRIADDLVRKISHAASRPLRGKERDRRK